MHGGMCHGIDNDNLWRHASLCNQPCGVYLSIQQLFAVC